MSETLRELSDAATPGEWEAVEGSSGNVWVETRNTATIADFDADYGDPKADAAFVVAAVNHVRVLLAATAPTPDEVGLVDWAQTFEAAASLAEACETGPEAAENIRATVRLMLKAPQ